MTTVTATRALVSFELRGAFRSRWVLVGSSIFALAAVATTLAGLRSFAALGLAGAAASIDGLLQVGLLLPPLMAMVLAASLVARNREQGLTAMIASRPVPRWALPLPSFLASSAAIGIVVTTGIGVALLLMVGAAGSADIVNLLGVLVVVLAATTISAALGTTIATFSAGVQQAVTVATGVWLMFTVGFDLALAGIAPGLGLRPATLLAAVAANPLEAARLFALSQASGVESLGPFGGYLNVRLGAAGAAALLIGLLTVWLLAPLAAACHRSARSNL